MIEHEQLLQNLIDNCSEETVKAFFRRKNTNFKRKDKELENTDPEKFSKVRKIGELNFDTDKIVFVFTDVKVELTERACRKAQFEAARKILQSENADAGIFIFKGANGAFRLSLVYKIYEGTKSSVSPYRRFTYFVQPDSTGNTTFKRQVGRCPFDSVEAIKEAFSIEAVSKEFYRELSNWYFWALKHIRFPSQNDLPKAERNPTCTIRMITRLMFVWFMKQMNLIPDEFFDRGKLGEILKSIEPEESTYYKAILQNLFFATLNTEMDHPKYPRRFRTSRDKDRDGSYGIHSVYRYKEMFCDSDATLDLFKTVPFLNGGLFECLDDTEKKRRIDGFSDRTDNELHVPNFLFFGGEHVEDLSESYGDKKHKKEKVSGLLDILSRYNFTVIENTPHESEVALDPELLGMVFENLLASYNPETQTTARKQTGSFYTPREIVNYMVDESLIAHLKNALTTENTEHTEKEAADENSSVSSVYSVVEENLRSLLSYDSEGNPFDKSETEKLIDAVDTCKILDPACGSGAFPMGVLHKLVLILSKLDPGNEQWLQRQIEKLDDVTMRDELERNFRENTEDYGRKLCLIENCIYGVDIQPIACQISKLRFFISLLCDQIVNPQKPNLGIRPLPNLETKFVAANTLIGIDRPDQMLLRNPEIDKLENELAKVRHEHFKARTPKTKRKYRELDDQLRHKIGDLLIGDGWIGKSARQVAGWNPYDQNTSASFFDPEWMFAIINGFDVVIGNPPYAQLQAESGRLAEMYEGYGYDVFARTADIYCLFYEKGTCLLREQGHLCFITSNTWMRARSCEKLRTYLSEKTSTRLLLDLGPDVFDTVVVDSNILLVQKSGEHGDGVAALLKSNFNPRSTEFYHYVKQNGVQIGQFDQDAWVILPSDAHTIKEKVNQAGIPLEDWDLEIFRGVTTGFNEAFIIDAQTRHELISADKNSTHILKPIIRGRDIQRYNVDFADKWLVATFPAKRINIDDYPAVRTYLKSFGKRLEQTGKKGCRKKTNHKWFETQDSTAYYHEFEKEKLLWIELVDEGRFSYDDQGMYGEATTYVMTGESITYLAALLNSKLINWHFNLSCPTSGMGTSRWKKVYVVKIPIPKLSTPDQRPFAELADRILALKKENPEADVLELEAEIDQLVYKLYDLTPEEIAIVEGKS